MAFRKAARTGAFKKRTADTEVPITWVQLLEDVATKPGAVSKAFRLFHNYSLGNAVMAMMQASSRGLELGPMASYNRWQALGRQVRKGEKAIWLNMPRTFKKTATDKATGEETEERGMYFSIRPATFLACQTDLIEGQADRSSELDSDPEAWDQARAMAALDVTFGSFNDVDGNLQGYFLPKQRTIAINPVASHPKRTLLHELAHAVLHADGYAGCESRGIAEAEAECVAMLVADSLGFGDAAESRGYVQTWLARTDREDLDEKMARRIFGTANRILQAGQPVKEVAEVAA